MKKVKSETGLVYKDSAKMKNIAILSIVTIVYIVASIVFLVLFIQNMKPYATISFVDIICLEWYNVAIVIALLLDIYFYNKQYNLGVIFELVIAICSFFTTTTSFIIYKTLSAQLVFTYIIAFILLIHSLKLMFSKIINKRVK